MSTYSLNLRGQLNRRLTINEMDGNFLYLQESIVSLSNQNTGRSVGEVRPKGDVGAFLDRFLKNSGGKSW